MGVDLPGFKGLSWNSQYWGDGFTRRKLRAVWITVVVLSVGALLPFAIYCFFQDHTSARNVVLVLGSIFTFLAVPTTLYGIWQHVSNYTQPLIQRYIIRILWMVPIYALDSWIVLILTKFCLAKYAYIPDTFREFYEAYTLYNFFSYLTKYLEISSGTEVGQLLENKHPPGHVVKHLPPVRFRYRQDSFSLLSPWENGEGFVTKCKWGVMAYVLYSPAYMIVTICYQSTSPDQITNMMFNFRDLYFYFTIGNAIISVWAVYCLVIFFHETRQELRPIKPLGKFLSIKGIVFLTFWQNLMLQLLAHFWNIEGDSKGSIYDKKHGLWNCPYSKYEVTDALNDFFLCIEMFVLSISFAFSFPSSEFKVPMDVSGLGPEGGRGGAGRLGQGGGGDVTVLPRSSVHPKLRALFDVDDVKHDIYTHTSQLIQGSSENVAHSLKSLMRSSLIFIYRIFGYDSYQVHYSLLLDGSESKGYQSTAYTAPEVPAHEYDSIEPWLTPSTKKNAQKG